MWGLVRNKGVSYKVFHEGSMRIGLHNGWGLTAWKTFRTLNPHLANRPADEIIEIIGLDETQWIALC